MANLSFESRFGSAMLSILTALGVLSRAASAEPPVAAAVTVLTNTQPPEPDRLDPALRAVAPRLTGTERAAWIAALAGPLRKAGIVTPRRVAAFFGQCSIESAGFLCLEEDLGYSAARLCQVWPERFPNTEAAEACALQPKALADRVYADRMGNGDEASGDGWRFHGRGLIQITGRTAYQRFALAMNMTLDQAADYAVTQAGAAETAVWFWSVNQLNTPADAWSVDLITRKINGGMTGAAERNRLCQAALQIIGA